MDAEIAAQARGGALGGAGAAARAERGGATGMKLRLGKWKIYPQDQIQRYLILDIAVCVFLFFRVLRADSSVGLPVTFLMLALFLALYYMGLWFRGWKLLAVVLAGCGLMAAFAVLHDPWILIFAAVYADFLGRVRVGWQLGVGLAALVAMYAAASYSLYGDALQFLRTVHLPFLIIQLAIPFVVRILEKSDSLKRELASANERIAHYVQEEERHRLARDLHDTLGQTLTMIKMKSELAERLMDRDPERAKREMREVARTSRLALKQVRDLVTDMRYVSLDQELELGRALLAGAGIAFECRRAPDRPALSKVTETMLALAVRESLTNVVKHSRAARCAVTETVEDGRYLLRIEDDGVGLKDKRTDGHGLAAIEERMRLLKGEAAIGPSPAGGVRVTLAIPLRSAEEDAS
jgi:two-component system sensor histidine kinase DesK